MGIKTGIKGMLAAGGLGAALCFCALPAASVTAPFEDYLSIYAKIKTMSAENEQNKTLRNEALALSQSVLAKTLNTYALDVRYAAALKKICSQIEPQTARIFPSRRMVDIRVVDALPPAGVGQRYAASKMGPFNPSESQVVVAAVAANSDYGSIVRLRSLIMDSFTLDILYRAAQYRVAAKEFANIYEQITCSYASGIIASKITRPSIPPDSFPDYYRGLLTQPGQNVVNPFLNFSFSYNNFNNVKNIRWDQQSFHSMNIRGLKLANPLHLPIPAGMEAKLDEGEVRAVFERLLSCVLCRELSRCFLEHSLQRLQKACSLRKRLDSIMDSKEAAKEARRFLLYNLTPRQEHEADIYAAKLGRSIGLTVQSFEDAFTLLYAYDKPGGEGGTVTGTVRSFDYVESLRTVRRVYSGEEL